jgi:Fic family protein
MRRYDYSFIKHLKIQTNIMSMTNRIEALRVKENGRKKSNPDVFTALSSIARIQSVKESNEIEGIVTTDKRMDEIVNKNSAPLNHNEMEIAGYRDVLDLIHNEYEAMSLNEDTILRMHGMMMSYTPRGGGKYKTEDNILVSIDEQGVRSIIFRPVSSKETSESMEQLILAYTDARDDAGIDPVLLIPCFILDFLCIHPFYDGNGRMSRLISLLLMYKNDMDVGKYISFEGRINGLKKDYYDSLRRSSEGWHNNINDYIPFIENFIFTLFSCYMELDKRFDVLETKKINKNNRIEATVKNSVAPVSKKDIMNILPDISQTTIEAKLSELVKQDRIKKVGSYKDARYIWKN